MGSQIVLECFVRNVYPRFRGTNFYFSVRDDSNNFWDTPLESVGWIPELWPFKWELLNCTFLWWCFLCYTKSHYGLCVCGWNPVLSSTSCCVVYYGENSPLKSYDMGRCYKERRRHFALSHFTFRLSTLSRAYSRLSIVFACIAARFPYCICWWRLSYIHTKQSRLTPEAYIKRTNEHLSSVSFPQIILCHWSKCRFPVFQIQWLQIGTSCQVIYYLIETPKNCLDLVQWYPCKRSFSDSFTFGRDWI